MYQCQVNEAPTFLSVHGKGRYFVIEDRNHLYNELLQPVYDLNDNIGSIHVDEKGVWTNYKNSKENGCLAETIVLGDDNQHHNKSHKCNYRGTWLSDGSYVAICMDGWDDFLVVYDKYSNKIAEMPGDFSGSLSANDKFLWVRKSGEAICCYDHNLSNIWTVETNKQIFSDVSETPMLFKNIVIVNVGEKTTQERGEFELNAYQMDTGELVWRQILETSPASSNLIGDKIYIFVADRFKQIDAQTGNIEIDIEHGFAMYDSDTSTYKGAVFPANQGLLFYDYIGQRIELRSVDATKTLQTIKLPETYTADPRKPPVFYQDNIYIELTHIVMALNSMKGGIAVLTSDNTAPTEIEASLEPRPPYNAEIQKNKAGNNTHFVTMTGDNIDEIIRYSCVVLKELAFKSGLTPLLEFETRDTNNTGELQLQINCSQLITQGMSLEYCKQKFSVIKDRVESQLETSGVLAGDGKSHFHVSLLII